MFEDVPSQLDFPTLETGVLKFWKDHDIAKQAIEKKDATKRPWVFFEGPPTANGRPGIHHVSARSAKDVFCRFRTMQGHRVDRRGGWDTHGLPVEIEVEKEIGSKGKQDIEKFGVAAFNQKCKDSVWKYMQDWRALTERMGYWVDLDRSYITYTRDYIESEWWILKNLWERGLLSQDYKTTRHCPRCNTSLADHEVSLGMKEDVDDPSVWIKFEADRSVLLERGLADADDARPVFLLAWTTTPWTLGANVAIGVSAEAEYAVIEAPAYWNAPDDVEKALYVVATDLAASIFAEGQYRILKTFAPQVLQGVPYAPVLEGDLVTEATPAYRKVLIDPSVETTSGSGVLHIATAYGDLEIGERHGLPVALTAGRDGLMSPKVRLPGTTGDSHFSGVFFKDADKIVIRDLKASGHLYKSERIKHAYPHCWRDDTPLLYFAKTSWYIRTSLIKDALVANNQKINWKPDHIRDGRFGRWLENNVDWAISRERFWGCPLPVWQAEDGSTLVVGSIKELESLTGRDLADLDPHRPHIDEVTFEKDGKLYRRVPDTIDVWFDSGAMPYAQWGFPQGGPFGGAAEFNSQFPADYIAEAMDQTRGWFYSLHAIAALLTYSGDDVVPAGPLAGQWPDSPAFKNVITQGFINDAEGRKMSKSRGNTVDPWSVFDKEGCDPLRWYFLSANPPGKNLAFKREDITQQYSATFLTLWNVYGFFVTYAKLSQPDLSADLPLEGRPEFDRWLEARRAELIGTVTTALETFDASTAANAIADFVDRDLSNWYLRLNRRRFWGRLDEAGAASAFRALFDALVTVIKLMAPLTPFFAEALYQNLSKALPNAKQSVHLDAWPVADESVINPKLVADMRLVADLVSLGRSARAAANLKVRQPLRQAFIRLTSPEEAKTLDAYRALIEDELNVRALSVIEGGGADAYVSYSLRPNFSTLGKRLGAKLNAFKQEVAKPEIRDAIVSAIQSGQEVQLDVAGAQETFAPEDFLLDVKDKGGYATAYSGGYLVALETELDEELIEAGRLREVLRQLQDLRRKAGLAVSDRIVLSLTGADAKAFVARHDAALRSELLAEDVVETALEGVLVTEAIDLDEREIVASLVRAGG